MIVIKVLLVDDEKLIRDLIKEYLDFEKIEYMEAENGETALKLAAQNHFDVIVLDIMMPKIDGFSVLRELRKKSRVPVIMLSARGDEYDKLFGFELGVDDYVTKPFNPKELIARIKAVASRGGQAQPFPAEEILTFGGLSIHTGGRYITIDGVRRELSLKEFEVLAYLARNKGIAISREKLVSAVWGYEFFGVDRTVDSHMKNLRKNLGKYRDHIKTVWGIGYKFEVKAE